MDTRVLIVDDDDRLRDVLSLHIDYEEGLEVAGTAADAASATALASELRPDAIVLDYLEEDPTRRHGPLCPFVLAVRTRPDWAVPSRVTRARRPRGCYPIPFQFLGDPREVR